MYEDHYTTCPFYADFKKREKANGAPLRADKSVCSYCEREKARRAEAMKSAPDFETTTITELAKFF